MTATDEALKVCTLRKAPWPTPKGQCAWCGNELPARRRRWCSTACRDAFVDNHLWTAARFTALERDGRACVRCGKTHSLEVNHRTPILGRHGQLGCHHHLDGLETLCHGCHLDETARQFGHRSTRQTGPTLFDTEATR